MDKAFLEDFTNEELKACLKQALSHLAIVCDHANEDCPEEYRTKWFNPALEEAYSFLQKMSEVPA